MSEGGLEDVHAQFLASAREQAMASELVLQWANVLAQVATRGFHENASVESRDGCQSDEQSRHAHLSAETRDGDLNVEALADYSAEKSRDVLVGCCGAHARATVNARVP